MKLNKSGIIFVMLISAILISSLNAVQALTNVINIEAEDFNRGNAQISTQYCNGACSGGKHIFNGGSSPNSVEYDINFPSVGSYNLEIKYAAEWSRPEDIYLDNVKVIDNGIASSTGSWYLSSGIWEKQGTLTITTSGIHTLKIVADNACCFPHIDAIRLTPLTLNFEAEDFNRGNAKISTLYCNGACSGGKHIFNGGSSPNSVEYDINFPSVGSYNLEIKYAAEWSRPEDIYLDNVKVIDNGIASSTGSWYLSSGIWEKQGTLTITTSGIHTLKIVADNTCCFPHIDAIRLTNSINNVFWSGKYTSNIETKNYINLKGVNSATLEYKINYSVSSYYQEAKRKICDSTDVCSVSIFYGKQPWTTHKIDLSSYIGKEIKILFFNLPYSNGGNGGLYIDDITVTTDKGVVFNDTADNFANWNNNGFSVVPKIT